MIELNGALQLVTDPTGVLRQMEAFDDILSRPERVGRLQVLMNKVTAFDPGGLLYMCSRIRALLSVGVYVTGTWPSTPAAVKTLVDADFTGFLQGRKPGFDNATRTLQLNAGSARQRVDAQLGANVRTFLGNLNPSLGLEDIDHINLAVMECVENVRQHAYSRNRRPGDAKRWHLVGLHNPDTRTSTVAILDLGVGMRSSIESQLNKVQKIFQWASQPTYDLIKEATLGLRTETGERHRGKGLRRLRDFAVDSKGRRLHVLSSDGMVTWSQSGSRERDIPKLTGTLVVLEIDTP